MKSSSTQMIEIVDKKLSGYTFIDLFAGMGGFRLALESNGAECVYSNEWNKAAQFVYFDNFGDIPQGDITKVDAATIPDHDILCAGFPCQAFSVSGKKLGFNDARGTLFFDVARIVKEKRPKVVFMENVKNFASHDGGRTLAVVKSTMEELGYDFHSRVLNPVHYNIPQKRERIFMVSFRKDVEHADFRFPSPQPLTRHVEDFLLPESETEHLYRERADFVVTHPDATMSYSDKPQRIGIVNKGCQGERIYSVKGIAITFSAFGGGVFPRTGGYLVNGKLRRLHIREMARIMGFPDTYRLSANQNQAYQQLGNSVVVDVVQYIAIEIGKALANERPSA